MGDLSFVQRELTGRRLVFNVIWYPLHLILFGYGWYSQVTNDRLAVLNGLKYSVWTSRGAGLVLAFDGGMILVPMLRNVVRFVRPQLSWLFPADENIWFHRQVAYQLLFWTIVHTTAHYVNFINVERTQVRKEAAWQIHVGIRPGDCVRFAANLGLMWKQYTQAGGITGHAMLLIMFLMYTTAHAKIRKQCFEAFWYTHHLAFFFMIAMYTHATGCFVRDSAEPDYIKAFPFYSTEHCLGYMSWRFTIWAGILYFGERVWREVRSRRDTKIVKVLLHPSGAMEICFIKPSFKYKPGMWLFLNCPDVSKFQWHPFTISSAPDDPYISVHVREVGDFTEALGARLGATPQLSQQLSRKACRASSVINQEKAGIGRRGQYFEIDSQALGRVMPSLRIDGPFGAPAEDVFKSDVAVLVGAGIGVTPFASILKHIWYQHQKGNLSSLRRVEFIWAVRETASVGWFQTLLEEIEQAQSNRNFLRISIYLTQVLDQDSIQNIALNDVGQDYDPLTLLRSRTLFGRPDFKSIFERLVSAIESGSYLPGREASLRARVGVYFCGPNALARVVRKESLAAATDTVSIKFAKEHF